MKDLKILHFADLHLDCSFAGIGLPPSVGKTRREGLIEILKLIFEIAIDRTADVVMIAGDLFEQDTVIPSTLKILTEQFEQIAPIPVLIAPGGADTSSQDSLYSRWSFPANVHIFNTQTLSPFQLTPEITVWGAAYPYIPLNDLLSSWERNKGINLLLLHYPNVQNQSDHFLNQEILNRSGMDFALLGGEHHHHTFPSGVMSGSPESIEPTTENREHGITLITVEQGNIQTEFIQIGRWQYYSVDVDLSGCEDMDCVEERVRQVIRNHMEQRHYLTITLTGIPQCAIDVSYLGEVIEEPVRFITRLNLPYDLDTLAKEPTVRGFLAKQFLDYMEKANPEDQSRILNALYIALQALDGAKDIINAIEPY